MSTSVLCRLFFSIIKVHILNITIGIKLPRNQILATNSWDYIKFKCLLTYFWIFILGMCGLFIKYFQHNFGVNWNIFLIPPYSSIISTSPYQDFFCFIKLASVFLYFIALFRKVTHSVWIPFCQAYVYLCSH